MRIIFLHYHSYSEASEAWNRRVKRINYSNVYFSLIEKDGCTHQDLKEFDSLPFEHKVALVHKSYPDIKCSHVIHGFEKEKELGNIMFFQGYLGKRYYDQFPWLHFFNNQL